MPRTILLEADNLTLATGTGIATYVRNLSSSVKTLGFEPSALVGVRQKLASTDPILNEIGFFDSVGEPSQQMMHQVRMAIDLVGGAPMGGRPRKVILSGAVVDPQPNRFRNFTEIQTVERLYYRARCHFKRFTRRMPIHVDQLPSLFQTTQPMPVMVKGVPNIYTIHDLVPLRLPYTTMQDKRYMLKMLRHIAREADHIVTVSEYSRRDIIRLLSVEPDRVTNTYQAVSLPEHLLNRTDDEVRQELESVFKLGFKDYFLFAGAIEPKKNIGRLIDAYSASGSKRPLVIAGGVGWMAETDLKKIDDERFLRYKFEDGMIEASRRVRRLNYLPFDQLVTLMRGARGLVFPSLFEGFGLPVLEAMILGTPVITSNVSSLPELAEGAALLVSPTDIEALAAAIRKIDADDDLCAELTVRGQERAKGFSSDAYTERLKKLYQRLV